MCACATEKATSWTVYDAKQKKIYNMTHEQFKNILLDNPHKLVSRTIHVRDEEIWVDCILNSGDFK